MTMLEKVVIKVITEPSNHPKNYNLPLVAKLQFHNKPKMFPAGWMSESQWLRRVWVHINDPMHT